MTDAGVTPQRRRGYIKYLIGSAVVLAGIFLIYCAARWTASADDPDVDQVAREWNATISRLGLEPIYPPQEDIVVGDIYLVVTKDWRQEMLSESLQGRALNVWHADLTDDLKQTYRQAYVFPETPREQKNGEPPPAAVSQGSIFDVPAERQSLPLALLPGFTAARIREVSASGSMVTRWLEAIGAFEARGEKTIELKIPSAETYGVSAIMANKHLQQFCVDFAAICTEDVARRALSSIVGEKAFEKVLVNGRTAYRLDVEILLINRIYLARAIESVVYTGSRLGAQAKAAAKLTDAMERIGKQIPSQPSNEPKATNERPGDMAGGVKPDQIASLRRELAEQKARLQAVISEATGTPAGGTTTIQSSDDSRISVTQKFDRPVAIAFRGIRMKLPEKVR